MDPYWVIKYRISPDPPLNACLARLFGNRTLNVCRKVLQRSGVHTVVVFREVLSFSFLPLNQPPPSALTEPVNKTCQQPIGGELLQTRTMDQ